VSFAGWDGEGANTCHDVADCFAFLERSDEAFVFVAVARVPVDFSEVEFEFAVCVVECNVEIVWTSKDLVWECPEYGVCSDILQLVDYCSYTVVLVHENLSNQILVRQELLS